MGRSTRFLLSFAFLLLRLLRIFRLFISLGLFLIGHIALGELLLFLFLLFLFLLLLLFFLFLDCFGKLDP